MVQSLFSFTIKVHTYLGAIFIAFAPMKTYLKDLIQSIGRYGGLSWHETGFKVLDAQVVSLLGADFLASKDRGQTPHVRGSKTI